MLAGAKKDSQLITSDWHAYQELIVGISVREVLHVPRDHGVITEMFRPDWDPTNQPVVQIYQSRLFIGALGACSATSPLSDPINQVGSSARFAAPMSKRDGAAMDSNGVSVSGSAG